MKHPAGTRACARLYRDGEDLAKPQRQSGALTADVLAVICLTAVQPRRRGRGIKTAEQAAERAKFDVALVAVLSDAGLRRSEASSLAWGDVQRWDDGSGRITVVRSKTDAEAVGAVVAVTSAAMQALDAIRPAGASGEGKVFGLSESQIARRVKAIAKAAGLADWEFFSGHSGRVGMARRMAQNGAPPTRSSARAAGNRAAAWSAATPAASPPGRRCDIYDSTRVDSPVSPFNAATTFRPWKRRCACSCRRPCTCFNAATTFRPWKRRAGAPADAGAVRFNAATTFRPWKPWGSRCTIRCDWYFNAATTFRPWKRHQVHAGQHALVTPSMRPRPFGRGNTTRRASWRCGRTAFNAATTFRPWKLDLNPDYLALARRLQCGHDLSAVETRPAR